MEMISYGIKQRSSSSVSEVEHFNPQRVSERVLFHLLRHPSVNQEVKFDPSNRLSPDHYLYTRNHPVDYFILLLQVPHVWAWQHFRSTAVNSVDKYTISEYDIIICCSNIFIVKILPCNFI